MPRVFPDFLGRIGHGVAERGEAGLAALRERIEGPHDDGNFAMRTSGGRVGDGNLDYICVVRPADEDRSGPDVG